MNGWSYDYMLATDDQNCQSRGQAKAQAKATTDAYVKEIVKKNLAEMQPAINNFGIDDVCGYVNWAFTESIDLKADVESKTPLEKMYTTCQAIQKNLTMSFNKMEND